MLVASVQISSTWIWHPTLTYISAAGTGTLVAFGKFTHVEIFYFRQWIVAFFSCTLATSTICTCKRRYPFLTVKLLTLIHQVMIAARIWNLNRGSLNGEHGGSLQPVMRIILESGAIYSGTLILLLVLFEIKSWLQYVVVDAVSTTLTNISQFISIQLFSFSCHPLSWVFVVGSVENRA